MNLAVSRRVLFVSRAVEKLTPLRQRLLDEIFETAWFNKCVLWFVLLDIWIFSVYGYANGTVLDVLGTIVLFVSQFARPSDRCRCLLIVRIFPCPT